MNTGMQDAANLAWKIAAVAGGAPDPLLGSYEQERAAVGKKLLSFTGRALRMATTENSLLEGLRNAILPLVTQLSVVQKAGTGFISETGIEYRHSPVVVDRGGDGDLRAGDRMPDLAVSGTSLPGGMSSFSGAPSLLENWTSPRHLAILCGAPASEVARLRQVLPQVDVRVVHPSQLDAEGIKVIGQHTTLLLVRPDGYIGYRGPFSESDAWLGYAEMYL